MCDAVVSHDRKCIADAKRAQRRADAAMIHLGLAARTALPRSRAARRNINFVHTQMDGYTHLVRTLRPIRQRDKEAQVVWLQGC